MVPAIQKKYDESLAGTDKFKTTLFFIDSQCHDLVNSLEILKCEKRRCRTNTS